MRWLFALPFLLCLRLVAQTPTQTPAPSQPTPQFSPQAAYDQAMRPLDIVRRSVNNWSDPEVGALAVGIKQAAAACAAQTPEQFKGEDLLAFARLCALGQMWQPVQQSANYYLIAQNAATPEEKLTGFPNLATAYDYVIQASLHLQDTENAILNAHAMLRAVPYDALASEATSLTVRYIQITDADEALSILTQRQALILALIKAHAPPTPGSLAPVQPSVASLPNAHPPLPLYALYADAIALPAMMQFENLPQAARDTYAALEAALPPNLSPDDTIFIAQTRRQYQLLGAPVPAFTSTAWLLDPTTPTPPDLKTSTAYATVYFLFPDWCAQCVGMGPQFTDVATRLKLNHIRFYALLAQDTPPPPAPKPVSKPVTRPGTKPSPVAEAPEPHVDVELGTKKSAAEYLAETSTLVVPNETLDAFAATDFPLIVVADRRGIIRAIQLAPDNALAPNGFLEQVVYHVLDHWPAVPKSPPPPQ